MSDGDEGCVPYVACIGFGSMIGALLVFGVLDFTGNRPVDVRKAVQTEAIAAGVARYVVNEKTGEVKFEWITPPQSEVK